LNRIARICQESDADDVVRHGVAVGRLAAFVRDTIASTLVEPPSVARAIAASLARTLAGMTAAEVAAFLRDEARRLDEGRSD
jgi:hypothetical protein